MDEIQKSHFLIYQSEDGKVKLDVRFENETVWLTQAMIVDLFQSSKANVSEHINNIFAEGELTPEATVRKFRTVRLEGAREVNRELEYYNLDMIISVGYRIKSKIATNFRIWATQHLSEFIRKGFVLDDERLQNPDLPFDYFDELLERIQKIRTSEKRFYQKITDIYATSIDYDPTADISIRFFQTVQNKMHWAITGQTAAEIVAERADHTLPNMGLTTFRGTKVRKGDVGIAKNYLSQEEIAALNNLTEQYLVFAQGQAMQRIPMYMKDWVAKLDGFITLNGRQLLQNAGKISHELAIAKAEEEYALFDDARKKVQAQLPNDFDKFASGIPVMRPKTRRRSKKSETEQ